LFYQYAVIDRDSRSRPTTNLLDGIAALPPQRPFSQQGADVFPSLGIFGSVRNLHVAPKNDYAFPIIVGADFIGL
jgi:hypothetical protein